MVTTWMYEQVSRPSTRAAVARLVTLPFSAFLALATSRIVIGGYGVASYGMWALVLAIPGLLPSRDLGLGARVIDVVARRSVLTTEDLEATIAAAVGKIARAAVGAAAIAVALQVVIGWHAVLGSAVFGVPDAAITASLVIFLLGLPGGVSGSILWGLQRNDLVALQAPVFTLGTCLAAATAAVLHWPLWIALIGSMAATFTIQWSVLAAVLPYLGVSRRSVAVRALRGSSTALRAWAVPMFVITTASAIGYQTDRIVLSHVAHAVDVAQYSVAAQLFIPLLGIISSAGYTLWARYALERSTGGVSRSAFRRTAAVFAAVGATEALLLTAAGPWSIRVLLGVDVPVRVCAAFGLLLLLQAMGLPFGMLLTDRAGLKRQALMFAAMVVVNIWLSLQWARTVGAAGPVLASALAYGLLVLAPSVFLCRMYFARDGSSSRLAAESDPTGVGVVIPTLGTRSEWLARAVGSVERQGERVRLCIVAPPEAVRALEAQFPGRMILGEARAGIVPAIEAGWQALPGCKVVTWLGDDDELTDGAVQKALKTLVEHPRAAMVFGDYERVDELGNRIVTVRPGRLAPHWLRIGQNFIAQPGCLYRRDAIARVGGLALKFRLAFDAALHLDLATRAVYCPEKLSRVRIHSARVTSIQAISSADELRAAVEERSREHALARILARPQPLWRFGGRVYYRFRRAY